MKEIIKKIILESLNELNMQFEETKRYEITEDFAIFGQGGKLDSLDFVNLIVTIEDNIFEKMGKSITIVSEKAFSKKYNPFANMERLAGFIQELMESEDS